MRSKIEDPKRNAGISLNQKEIDRLNSAIAQIGFETRSSIISILIERYLDSLVNEMKEN